MRLLQSFLARSFPKVSQGKSEDPEQHVQKKFHPPSVSHFSCGSPFFRQFIWTAFAMPECGSSHRLVFGQSFLYGACCIWCAHVCSQHGLANHPGEPVAGLHAIGKCCASWRNCNPAGSWRMQLCHKDETRSGRRWDCGVHLQQPWPRPTSSYGMRYAIVRDEQKYYHSCSAPRLLSWKINGIIHQRWRA